MKPVRFFKKRQGFTLLEMAVALAIVGVMAGVALQAEHATKPDTCYAQTQMQLNTIRTAIDSFASKNSKLPYPAGRGYGVADVKFGAASTLGASDITQVAGVVSMGALPFQALGLPASYAADCWGNKFTYAVSNALITGYAAATGGSIVVKSGSGAIITSTAAYVVVSHGKDGVGAVARNYRNTTAQAWCTLGTVIETENCDTSNIVFVSTGFNNGKNAGNNFFDDLIVYGAKQTSNCNDVPKAESWTVGTKTCSSVITSPVSNADSVNIVQTKTGALNPAGQTRGTATYSCTNNSIPTVPSASPVATCVEDGMCGSANGVSTIALSPSPATVPNNLCYSGTVTAFTAGATSFTWSCTGIGSGTPPAITASCSATRIYPTCSTSSLSWGGGCSATFGSVASGGSTTATNSAGGFTGSASASCTSGAWSTPSGSCTANPIPCSATSRSWGGSCVGNFAGTGNGGTSSASNITSGYTGNASMICNNGTWGTASGPCTANPNPCGTTTMNWGAGCTGTFNGVVSGGSSSATNTNGGYTGAASSSCNNGSWSAPSGSCDAIPAMPPPSSCLPGPNICSCGEEGPPSGSDGDIALVGCCGSTIKYVCNGGGWNNCAGGGPGCGPAVTCSGRDFPCPGRGACDPVYGDYGVSSEVYVTCYNSAYDTPIGSAGAACQSDGSWRLISNSGC